MRDRSRPVNRSRVGSPGSLHWKTDQGCGTDSFDKSTAEFQSSHSQSSSHGPRAFVHHGGWQGGADVSVAIFSGQQWSCVYIIFAYIHFSASPGAEIRSEAPVLE